MSDAVETANRGQRKVGPGFGNTEVVGDRTKSGSGSNGDRVRRTPGQSGQKRGRGRGGRLGEG